MLTDTSLALVAERLPRLTEVNLTYCEKITPDGILSFLASYPEMQVRALIALHMRRPIAVYLHNTLPLFLTQLRCTP